MYKVNSEVDGGGPACVKGSYMVIRDGMGRRDEGRFCGEAEQVRNLAATSKICLIFAYYCNFCNFRGMKKT